MSQSDCPKVAFLAFHECAIWQVALLQKFLNEAGWINRTLTLDGRPVTTDGGLLISPHGSIGDASPWDYQLVLIAGGTPDMDALEDARLHRFLRQCDGHHAWIAATCAASAYLGAAGLLGGLRFTCLKSVVESLPDVFVHAVFEDTDVCVDGNIITCKGHAHVQFLAEVSRRLTFGYRPGFTRLVRKLACNTDTE